MATHARPLLRSQREVFRAPDDELTLDLRSRLSEGGEDDREQAFELLYEAYYSPGVAYAARIIRNPDDAPDVYNEAFGAILRWYDPVTTQFARYFGVVIRNCAFRYRQQSAVIRMVEYSETMLTEQMEADEAAVRQADVQWVREALGRLDFLSREILMMYYQERRTYDEIAAYLGVARSTSKSHVFRALQQLRRLLEK